jgi:hypothetical protein
MKHLRNLILSIVAGCSLIAATAQNVTHPTSNPASTTPQETAAALGKAELAISEAITANAPADFGRAQGRYWALIQSSNDFPRAYHFFTGLAAKFPKNADVLATKGAAIGGYIGWLAENKDAGNGYTLAQLDSEARASFEQALKLQPESFSALYGYAMYESFAPRGKEHAKDLLAKLDTLREKYREYPWPMVDELESRLSK